MQNRFFYIIFSLLITFSITTEAQKLVNSPYSRFNLGRLEPNGSFRSSGMGGIGMALRDNNSIQFNNPSSYSSFDTLSFIFDFGIDYSKSVLSNGNSDYSSYDLNFHHFILGFPIAKGVGVSAGIVPFSNGFYNLSEEVTTTDPDYDPITGPMYGTHKGTGGYNKVFFGSGINLGPNFSAGANLTVLFGKIERVNQVTMMSDNYMFDTKFIESISLNGLNFDLGMQYHANLKKDFFVNAGFSFTPGKNYKSNYNSLKERISLYSLSPYSPDTLENTSLKNGKVFLPQSLRIGLAFGKKDKIVVGIDYIFSKWSESTIPGTSGYITDSQTIQFGMEYTPERYSNSSYFKGMDYRVGGHFSNNYVVINGSQLNESGVSAGLGFPMLGSISKTNIFF